MTHQGCSFLHKENTFSQGCRVQNVVNLVRVIDKHRPTDVKVLLFSMFSSWSWQLSTA
jgi:hypothetical protein